MDDATRDRLYLDLKGILERASRAQVHVEHQAHRDALGEVCSIASMLGVFYAPQQWSRFDEPPLPDN
jgi:hypothetical protein